MELCFKLVHKFLFFFTLFASPRLCNKQSEGIVYSSSGMETAISVKYFPLYATSAAYSNMKKMPSALVGNADKITPAQNILFNFT